MGNLRNYVCLFVCFNLQNTVYSTVNSLCITVHKHSCQRALLTKLASHYKIRITLLLAYGRYLVTQLIASQEWNITRMKYYKAVTFG
jgi:hypothetical protein